MKNNQYFACLSVEGDDCLVIGKGIIGKDKEVILYTNNDNIGFDDIAYASDYKHENFEQFYQMKVDPSDPQLLFDRYSLYGFTPISKERYLKLSSNKKEFNNLEIELQEKYLLGEVVNEPVRKIGKAYVFGCGAVSLTAKEIRTFTTKIEAIKAKKDRYESIDEEMSDLEDEKYTLDKEIINDWNQLDSALDSQLSRESLDIDDFNDDEIENIKDILTK